MMILVQIMVSVESLCKTSVTVIQVISILIVQVNNFDINLKDLVFPEYLELWKNIKNNLSCILLFGRI